MSYCLYFLDLYNLIHLFFYPGHDIPPADQLSSAELIKWIMMDACVLPAEFVEPAMIGSMSLVSW